MAFSLALDVRRLEFLYRPYQVIDNWEYVGSLNENLIQAGQSQHPRRCTSEMGDPILFGHEKTSLSLPNETRITSK